MSKQTTIKLQCQTEIILYDHGFEYDDTVRREDGDLVNIFRPDSTKASCGLAGEQASIGVSEWTNKVTVVGYNHLGERWVQSFGQEIPLEIIDAAVKAAGS